jgi:hypothetical protein
MTLRYGSSVGGGYEAGAERKIGSRGTFAVDNRDPGQGCPCLPSLLYLPGRPSVDDRNILPNRYASAMTPGHVRSCHPVTSIGLVDRTSGYSPQNI